MGIDKIATNNQVYGGKAAAKITVNVPEKIPAKAPAPEQTPKHEAKIKEPAFPVKKRADSEQKIEERNEAFIEENKKVKNAIAEVNRKMNQKTRCEFSYHEDTKRVSIKVIDSETEEVIREIPPEETLDMLSKMWEVAGILIDEHR